MKLLSSTSHFFFIRATSFLQQDAKPYSIPHQAFKLLRILLKVYTMAFKNCAPLFICSLLLLATFSNACGSCKPVKPHPAPKTPPVNPSGSSCPRDTLKLGVCADLLGLISLNLGSPPSGDKCCPLLSGLADLEVAACLCTALKANVLGINLNVPIALSALVSACGKTIPKDFQCA